MAERKAKTMELSGNDYAKVAERLKLFRTDWPKSKTETAYEYDPDKSVTFTVWLWKDKADYIDVLKEVKDAEMARGSADANGTARGEIGVKLKDFEKLETIALGRALGMMGYLASGEIASFEEMEEFNKFRADQTAQAVKDAIKTLELADTLDDLKAAFVATGMMNNPDIVKAKDKRKAELSEPEKPEAKPAAPKKPVEPKAAETPRTSTPSAGPSPTLALEEPDADSPA